MMMLRKIVLGAGLSAILLASAPALAAGRLKSANVPVAVARSVMTVKPDRAWSKMGRPGRIAESWTLDGLAVNDLTFFGGITEGKALFKEVDKVNSPLPKFSKTMLIPDVAQMFESSYRIARNTSIMKIETMEPAAFAGAQGFRFTYSFAEPDNVKRLGEARGAIIGDALYMITYEAPRIHYFDRDLAGFRAVADSASFPAVKKK